VNEHRGYSGDYKNMGKPQAKAAALQRCRATSMLWALAISIIGISGLLSCLRISFREDDRPVSNNPA